MRSSIRGAGPWFWNTVVAVVITSIEVDERPEQARRVGLAHASTGAFRHDRSDRRRPSGSLEQLLASDREADGADPVLVDVRPVPEVVGSCEEIGITRPAHDVSLAGALPARDEEQHAVSVSGEHQGLLRTAGPG